MILASNPIVYLTRKMWKYSEGNRQNVVLYFSLFACANAVYFFEPLVIAKVLNIIQERGVTGESVPALAFFLVIFFLLRPGFCPFLRPARIVEMKNAFLVRANYKKYLLDGVMTFPMEWHTDHHSGDTIDKIEKGTRALYDYSGDTFQVIESVMRLAGSYFALVYFNFHAAYIVLFMVVATIFMITRFDRVLIRQYRTLYGAENKISEKIFDAVSNITTVVILRIEKMVSSSIYKRIMEPFKLFTANKKINEVKWFLASMASTAMTVLVLGSYFYVNFRLGAAILVGTVYALYGYVDRISGLFFRFAYLYGDIVQQKAAVMNAEEISNDFRAASRVRQLDLDSNWRELKIDSLKFSYHTAEGADLHLDGVSLTIKRGERVALIGESGSGKTTLLKIIRELYNPGSVKVYLDGKPLKRAFRAISSDIALIPQDPEIFSTTIRENITVGINHTADYIKKFTDMACFTEVAERLPKKLDSYIFEKGVNLSGGEKQRLALARGLMACDDKSIVLLDEPTSSVDTKNELRIYRNIFESFKRKTIIASVHRLHLLSLFDRIYFFKGGKIIASGALHELLRDCEEFKNLWERYHKLGKRREFAGKDDWT